MTALPNRTDPSFAMYYDDIDRLRFGIGGAAQRLSRTSAIVLTDSDVVSDGTGSLLTIPNVAVDGMLALHGTDAMTHSIRIKSAAGTEYFIMCTTTETNRTDGG
jgi:hypothetical protein